MRPYVRFVDCHQCSRQVNYLETLYRDGLCGRLPLMLIPDPCDLENIENEGCRFAAGCLVVSLWLPIILILLVIVAALGYAVFEVLKFW